MSAILGERIARFKTLIWFDAMGLSLFCVVGAQAAYALGHGPVVVVMMGTIAASFGGLLRDIVCNEVPLILREDIYATAALLGALTFWVGVEPRPDRTLGDGAWRRDGVHHSRLRHHHEDDPAKITGAVPEKTEG